MMPFLTLILGGLIGLLVYHFCTRETTKSCPYCGEKIKQKAILCRFCNSSLITPVEKISRNVKQIKEELIDNNVKKVKNKPIGNKVENFLDANSINEIGENFKQIKEEIVDNNVKKAALMTSLSISKNILRGQIFGLEMVRLFNKKNNN